MRLLWGAVAGLVLTTAAPPPAAAQSPTLTVTLQSNTPRVRSTGLLADGKFVGLMRSGFPLRLHYSLELWKVRAGWFDQFVREVAWDAVARNDPLADDFVLIRQGGKVSRYATPEELSAALDIPYVVTLRPSSTSGGAGGGPLLLCRAARGDDAQRYRPAGTVALALGRRGTGRGGRRKLRGSLGAGGAARAGTTRGPAASAARGAQSYDPN